MPKVLQEFIATADAPFPKDHLGDGYRCSVELVDGTELPCVMLRNSEVLLELVQRRIAEEGKGKGVFSKSPDPPRDMLAHFLTKGNRVSAYDIKIVKPADLRFP